MNEAATRGDHIDPALKAAGWGLVDGSRIRRENQIAPGRITGHGKSGTAIIADYVLEYRNTRLATVCQQRLAVLEQLKKSLLH